MKTFPTTRCGTPICIGRQGENLVTQITHAYDPAWTDEDYSIEVYARRPRETAAYAVAYVTDDRALGVVTWTVSAADTGIAGAGRMQIRFVADDGAILKTEVFDTIIRSAIDEDVGDAPDVYETWLAALQELADETAANAAAAAESAEAAAASEANAAESETNAAASETAAADSASSAAEDALIAEGYAVGTQDGTAVSSGSTYYQNNAAYYAEVAQQGAEAAGYAWFDVEDSDGHLYVTVTDSINEDVVFAVDESTGNLEVTVNG